MQLIVYFSRFQPEARAVSLKWNSQKLIRERSMSRKLYFSYLITLHRSNQHQHFLSAPSGALTFCTYSDSIRLLAVSINSTKKLI